MNGFQIYDAVLIKTDLHLSSTTAVDDRFVFVDGCLDGIYELVYMHRIFFVIVVALLLLHLLLFDIHLLLLLLLLFLLLLLPFAVLLLPMTTYHSPCIERQMRNIRTEKNYLESKKKKKKLDRTIKRNSSEIRKRENRKNTAIVWGLFSTHFSISYYVAVLTEYNMVEGGTH